MEELLLIIIAQLLYLSIWATIRGVMALRSYIRGKKHGRNN